MFRPVAACCLLGLLLTAAGASRADDGGREAAEVFGRALTTERLQSLRSILPTQGRVRLKLVRLGPEDGVFGAGQVEAILGDFLARGAVKSFEVLHVEGDERTYSVVRSRAVVEDGNGRTCRVGLHLTFQPEKSRWVLREIKETSE